MSNNIMKLKPSDDINFEQIDVVDDVSGVQHVDFIKSEAYRKFIKDVKTSVIKIAGEHDLTLVEMQDNKTAFDVALNLKVAPVETVSMDLHGRNYLAHGLQFNLKPEWFSHVVVVNIKDEPFSLKITGLCMVDSRALVRLSTSCGIRYMKPTSVVELMLKENRKSAYSTMTVQLIAATAQRKSLHDKLFGRKRTENLIGTESTLLKKEQLQLANN